MGTRFQVSSGTLWNAFWNAFGTRSERVRNANGTQMERVPDAFRTQMERERSVRLFLSSTVVRILSYSAPGHHCLPFSPLKRSSYVHLVLSQQLPQQRMPTIVSLYDLSQTVNFPCMRTRGKPTSEYHFSQAICSFSKSVPKTKL